MHTSTTGRRTHRNSDQHCEGQLIQVRLGHSELGLLVYSRFMRQSRNECVFIQQHLTFYFIVDCQVLYILLPNPPSHRFNSAPISIIVKYATIDPCSCPRALSTTMHTA